MKQPCLRLQQLSAAHMEEMMRLQDVVMKALPDPNWYFPSEREEFEQWLHDREAFGVFHGDRLVAYAALGAWDTRGERCYARKLGEPEENTYDFHDVLVHPAYRGRGIHTRFLELFTEMARAAGGRAIYATVDPGNAASWRNFERAGYECVCTRPAYDGRARRYYRLSLV